MPRKKLMIPVEGLRELARLVASLPAKPKARTLALTQSQALRKLSIPIKELLRKGHDDTDVVTHLRAVPLLCDGLSDDRLRNHIKKCVREESIRKRKQRDKAAQKSRERQSEARPPTAKTIRARREVTTMQSAGEGDQADT